MFKTRLETVQTILFIILGHLVLTVAAQQVKDNLISFIKKIACELPQEISSDRRLFGILDFGRILEN